MLFYPFINKIFPQWSCSNDIDQDKHRYILSLNKLRHLINDCHEGHKNQEGFLIGKRSKQIPTVDPFTHLGGEGKIPINDPFGQNLLMQVCESTD